MRQLTTLVFILLLPQFISAQFIRQQTPLDGNNISTFIINSGIADNNIAVNNQAGFEWPKGSGKFAIFTSGLTMGGYFNDELRLATASYTGEFRPGYIFGGQPYTNQYFKIYKIKRGDNQFNNPDYANWGFMVEYGAPYVDVNNNGLFEPSIDTPGVKHASQTIFLCMTDGFPESHVHNEGFSGGTAPLMAEVHFTAWCYDSQGLEDVQFRKWEVINKSTANWSGMILSIISDPDLGNASDDWMGCDTALKLGFVYNGSNKDSITGTGNNYYGTNPPAVGICYLKTPKRTNGREYGLPSFNSYTFGQFPFCWRDPNNPAQAYNFLKGFQKDGTPHINAVSMNTTKFLFEGDPETGTGWTESDGAIENCGGDTTGTVMPSPAGDRRMIMNSTDTTFNMLPGQSTTIVAAYMIARGTNYLNSVTKLKQLAGTVKNFWETVGIQQISSEIPQSFRLHQNYPNPFNPSTKIRFEIPKQVRKDNIVQLIIYDIAGKEITRLVNQELTPGVYEYEFDGAGLASGMYFYKLEAGDFVETKKMVLLK